MMRGILAVSVGLSTVFLAAGTARAADEPVFGKAGQLSIGSDLNLAATGSLLATANGFLSGGGANLLTPATMLDIGGATSSNNGGSQTGFSLGPAADYFVVDNLSLGLELLFGYDSSSPPAGTTASGTGTATASSPSTNGTLYGIAPRIGYNVPLGGSMSIWPKVFLEQAGYSLGGAGAGYGNIQLVGAYVPFLYHPVPHFYVGLGPNVLTELGSHTNGVGATSKVTSYGLFASIGGWVKLGDLPAFARPPPPTV
jgi:hypothetical protein